MRNLNPKISVVIPFYERVDWLIEAIESVLIQTYRNYEIIVINDGSSENMASFVELYGDKINYIYKENGGPGAARNKGIELAKGEYIAFLDSDDIWCNTKLERQIEFMISTSAVWSHTGYLEFSGNKDLHSYIRNNNKGDVFSLLLLSFRIATPTVMVSNEFLKDNTDIRFAENMRYGQDHFFWLKLAFNNSLDYLPEILTKVRIRGQNAARRTRVKLQVSSQLWQYFKENSEFFLKNGRVDFITRIIYSLIDLLYNFVLFIERNLTKNKYIIELLSKFLYLLPYILRKIYAYLLLKLKFYLKFE